MGAQAPQTGRRRQRAESEPEETDPHFRRGILRHHLLNSPSPLPCLLKNLFSFRTIVLPSY